MRCLLIFILFLTSSLAAQPVTHGPFIGHTTSDSAAIWARAERAGPLELAVWPEGGGEKRVFVADARAERDLCVVWKIDGLTSKRTYRYRVIGPNGQALDDAAFRFTTARTRDAQPHRLKIAFGSCAREDEGTAGVWRQIAGAKPDAIVLLGDTPYIDSTDLAIQRRRYREFAAFPSMRDLLRSTPCYATWDDHDFGKNDTDGRLEGKENSRRAFLEYHANGSYGDGTQGIYTSFRRAAAEVFLLDARTFAATEPSPFDPEKPTLLGRAQWDWLRDGLRESKSTFKVIACGMIFNGATRPNKPDHWMSYPHEREALFRFIGEEEIPGVVLVSGDIHRSRVLKYKTTSIAGYDITELITSPMHDSIIEEANAPHPDLLWDGGIPHSFLILTADTTGRRTLTGSFMNAAGTELCRVRLEAAKLRARTYARADLPPLLEFLGGARVRHPEEWPERREEIRGLMTRYFIGSFPERTPAIVETKVLEETKPTDGSLRRRVRLTFDTPHRASFEVRVWIPPGDGPFPVLLTQPRYYQLPWAELALARGYIVCLYPGVDSHHREADYPGYESVWETFRHEFPDATWTEISTKAWLGSRALDHVLSSYPAADGRVGIIGFSRYGKQSLIAAAFDERITSVVARSPGSPGSCPYRFTSRNTFAETPSDFPGEWFLESLKSYTGREHELPIDAHGWLGLIAPRRCLIHTGHNDGSEPTFAVERAYLEGRSVYSLLGKPENLRVLYRSGQHGPITDEQRRQNLDWLDLSFGRGPARQSDFPEELIHEFDWTAWRARQAPADLEPPPSSAPIEERIEWALGAPEPAWQEKERDDRPVFLTDEESSMMTHDRWTVENTERIPVTFGASVRGNIYHNPTVKTAAAAVIWLHPYSYHSGYNEGYGVLDTTVYHRLAREGLVVLAYDQCGFGLRLLEGRDFYARHPRWSRLGRMIEDLRAAVDFLAEGRGRSKTPLPPIDPERIFVLGYSLGGMVALYAGALDGRVAGVASFSGFTPMRTDTADRPTGGLRRLWKWHALQPKLGLFEGRESELPYDFDDVLRLIAPRPCLVFAPNEDRDATTRDVRAVVERAREAWPSGRKRRSANILEHESRPGPPRFQRGEQVSFLAWLEAVLKE